MIRTGSDFTDLWYFKMATPRATNRYTSSDVLAFFNGDLEFPSLSDHESDMEVEEGSGQSNVDEPVDDLSEKSTSEDEESTGEDETSDEQ